MSSPPQWIVLQQGRKGKMPILINGKYSWFVRMFGKLYRFDKGIVFHIIVPAIAGILAFLVFVFIINIVI